MNRTKCCYVARMRRGTRLTGLRLVALAGSLSFATMWVAGQSPAPAAATYVGPAPGGACRRDLCRLGRVWSLPCTDLRALEAHAHGERAAGSARTSRGDRRRLHD